MSVPQNEIEFLHRCVFTTKSGKKYIIFGDSPNGEFLPQALVIYAWQEYPLYKTEVCVSVEETVVIKTAQAESEAGREMLTGLDSPLFDASDTRRTMSLDAH